ncbi:MAG: 30S ribosomal protein S13 [Candidatus Pacebacteria bacterium]|jgi:small subunit ribosomal protein S13|nr:30S ribosomal protein S13 [Candidatus Paceibacterota bacterium]MBT4652368.1 30S ribosomal protein S13 [Candidatus Paceibacterota bacterium]MBT6756195.1 30S ribosomal protein S13 [Candidatus Paceibacterota bacterium]MBT6921486.1 30S ribosomal protein S13 [Candidatus Paceibacterota bacterium]
MPRIAGTDIPEHKKVVYSLRSVFGVGKKVAQEVVAQAKIDPDTRARDLTSEEINKIQRILEKYPLEGDLRRMVSDNVQRLKRIKSYRGLRHSMGLPVRGQRTKVNSRTVRGGGRRTVGSVSKEAAASAAAK